MSVPTIARAVSDPAWQAFRIALLGLSTEEKMVRLEAWTAYNHGSGDAQVQVDNYKNALRRAGLLCVIHRDTPKAVGQLCKECEK